VFHAYETDDALATLAARTGDEVVTGMHVRLATTTLPDRQLDPVIKLLLECVNHALGVAGVLRSVAPDAYPRPRVEDAITDVLHRTFFGLNDGVNAHAADDSAPQPLELTAGMRELLQPEPDASSAGVRAALLTAGHDVFVTRGYHNTRVDDLAAAAGVSHGAFYRYFRNKGELARVLTARAIQGIGTTLVEMPDVLALDTNSGGAALRKWLRRYNAAHAREAAMLRVWMDAALQDPVLRAEYAPPLDWGRRRMARYLRPRSFGDVEMDAVVVVALLGVFGTRARSAAEVDAAARIIERGLLGR
jgi:AcrR family transcriptional regulator